MKQEINDYNFNTRALNVFRRNGIRTMKELQSLSVAEISRLKGMGSKTLDSVIECLNDNNIFLEISNDFPEVNAALSGRIKNMLKRSHIYSIEDLKNYSYNDLQEKVSGFGPVSKKELSKYLKKYGITLLENT